MRRTDAVGIFGTGLLIAALIFLAVDPKLFDHWYDWILGPFFWMMGCALVVTWILGRMHDLLHRPDKDKLAEKPAAGFRDPAA